MPVFISPGSGSGYICAIKYPVGSFCLLCRRPLRDLPFVEIDTFLDQPMESNCGGVTVYKKDLLSLVWEDAKNIISIVPCKYNSSFVPNYYLVIPKLIVNPYYNSSHCINYNSSLVRPKSDYLHMVYPMACSLCGAISMGGGHYNLYGNEVIPKSKWNGRIGFTSEGFITVDDNIAEKIRRRFGSKLSYEEVDILDEKGAFGDLDENLPFGGWGRQWFYDHNLVYCRDDRLIPRNRQYEVDGEELVSCYTGASCSIIAPDIHVLEKRVRRNKTGPVGSPCVGLFEQESSDQACVGYYGGGRAVAVAGESQEERFLLEVDCGAVTEQTGYVRGFPPNGVLTVFIGVDNLGVDGTVRVVFSDDRKPDWQWLSGKSGVPLSAGKARAMNIHKFRQTVHAGATDGDGTLSESDDGEEPDVEQRYEAWCDEKYWKGRSKALFVQFTGPLMDLPSSTVGCNAKTAGQLNLSVDIDGALLDIEFSGRLLLSLPNPILCGFGEIQPKFVTFVLAD